MWEGIVTYFQSDMDRWLGMLQAHITVSVLALLIAVCIAVPMGVLSVRYPKIEKAVTALFGFFRVIPSLAILLLVLPVLGTGVGPATVALVLLGIPPIMMNTITGFREVSPYYVETAEGLGMEDKQIWLRIRFPLAMPMILTGIKTAAVEIVASATLASKIGAGGLGDIIFTGLGLFRTDLLVIGGASVALLSLSVVLLFGLLEKILFRYR